MNKFKITVTTTLLGLSLMSVSTYANVVTAAQVEIEAARAERTLQASNELQKGNYSKAIEYAEPVANAPITEFNQEIISNSQFILGYSYLVKKNKKKAILWFQKSCKNGFSSSCSMLEKIKR